MVEPQQTSSRQARELAVEFGLPYVDLESERLHPAAAAAVSADVLRRVGAFPYRIDAGRLQVAVADPADIGSLDALRLAAAIPVDLAITTRSQVDSHLRALQIDATAASTESHGDVAGLVDAIIRDAADARASDVHFVPQDGELIVRIRIDGVLRELRRIARADAAAAMARIKIVAVLDIAEHRRPQDGRFEVTATTGVALDVRVAVLPTVQGEGAILRLLERTRSAPTLTEIGLSFGMQLELEQILNRSTGALLVTGPTGSGKSTTLYAALADLNRADLNVITVEDPVEHQLPGTYQVQVNSKVGLTFATALRSILRGDPDVLMVGEIRDGETARISIEAALTGHFVLSTLHTNDAPGAITRLSDMGIEPFLTTSAVSAVLAQRLVRRLCSECREAYVPDPTELVDAVVPPDATFFRPRGCSSCRRGYTGRIGIFQLLVVSGSLTRAALAESAHDELERAALNSGMRSLWQDGIDKAAAGLTSLDELRRALH